MKKLRIEIDRLNLSFEGVPQNVVEAAIHDLGHELRTRLARMRWLGTHDAPPEVDRVSIRQRIGSVDATSLRSIIAENLVEEIRRAAQAEEEF